MSPTSSESTSEKTSARDLIIQGVAGVFVTVLAPILVLCGEKFSERAVEPLTQPEKPAVTAPEKPTEDPKKAAPDTKVAPDKPVVQPTGTNGSNQAARAPVVAKPAAMAQRLFNGTDLTGFYTFIGVEGHAAEPQLKDHDPDHVFEVKEGLIHISGKALGLLVTEEEYDNYHLLIEYQWGGKSWPPYESKARNSGLLLHCNGLDGDVNGLWMKSVRCCITEGRTGDFLLYPGEPHHRINLTVEAEEQPEPQDGGRLVYLYKPGELLTKIAEGRIARFPSDRHWQDLVGYRGKEDLEEPLGSWNSLECVCRGDQIIVCLNGQTVNVGSKCNLKKGKIAIQSLGSEILIRRMELQSLSGSPQLANGNG